MATGVKMAASAADRKLEAMEYRISSIEMSRKAATGFGGDRSGMTAEQDLASRQLATSGTHPAKRGRTESITVVVAAAAKAQAFGAAEVAAAIVEGVHATLPSARVLRVPDIDTGTCFIEQVVALSDGWIERISLLGLHGELVLGELGLIGHGEELTAVIAADEAVEISRDIRHPPDPTAASSRAIGQLISAALDRGARRIIVGCGDSGAYDGGIGMAGALGVRFLDADRAEIVEAGGLLRLAAIDVSNRDPRLSRVAIQAVVDPGQALLGIDSVVAANGPRHGASPTQVLRMEQGLARFAKVVHECLGIEVASLPGAGAAGGLAAGLAAFGGATVISHADFLDQLDALRTGLAAADMVISAGPATERDTTVVSLATEGSGSAWSCTWLERKAAILGLPVIALSPERLVATHRLDEGRETTAASADRRAAQLHPLQEGALRLPAASAASLRRALGGWHRPAESA